MKADAHPYLMCSAVAAAAAGAAAADFYPPPPAFLVSSRLPKLMQPLPIK